MLVKNAPVVAIRIQNISCVPHPTVYALIAVNVINLLQFFIGPAQVVCNTAIFVINIKHTHFYSHLNANESNGNKLLNNHGLLNLLDFLLILVPAADRNEIPQPILRNSYNQVCRIGLRSTSVSINQVNTSDRRDVCGDLPAHGNPAFVFPGSPRQII